MESNLLKITEDKNWLICPVCDTELESRNINNHLARNHDGLSEKGRRRVINKMKIASRINNHQKMNKSSLKKNHKPFNKLDNNSMVRSRLKKVAMSIGIVLVILIVTYSSNSPAKSDNYEFDSNELTILDEVNSDGSFTWQPVSATNFYGIDVLTGQDVSLAQFKGKIVLLNFVNYGCNPQINEIVSSQLIIIKELYEARGDFESLSVFCGCCPESTLKDFAKQNDFNWTWMLDNDYSIIRSYNQYVSAYGYPTLVFVDAIGKIQDVTGYLDKDELSSKIDLLI
jgi:hypothetical protein